MNKLMNLIMNKKTKCHCFCQRYKKLINKLQNSSITNIAEKFIESIQEPVNKTPIVQSSKQKTNKHALFTRMYPMTRTKSGNLKSLG
jgi:hypothetical protein